MKKLFSFFAILLCTVMLSSSAFASGDDAYALYQKSLKKMEYVMSMDFSYSNKSYIGNDNGYVEISGITTRVQTLMPPNRKLQMGAKAFYTQFDIKTGETADLYIKDGDSYVRSPDNEKTKEKTYMGDMSISEVLCDIVGLDLTENDFKDAIVEKVDGGAKITFKTKTSSGNRPHWSILTTSVNIVIGDDGMLKSYSESETCTNISDNRHIYSEKSIKSLKIKSVDSIAEIDFPADLDTYKKGA